MPHLVCVKILGQPQLEFLPHFTFSEEEASQRLLSHHLFAKKRSFGTMNLETSVRMFDRERVVELRQKTASETDHTHHSVFERASSETLLFR